MKVDGEVSGRVGDAGAAAAEHESDGYDGIQVGEIAHDPFLLVALAAGRTARIELLTGVAVAFARNPMTLAATAYDLQELSAGRYVLGLGSQVKAHVTRRFSMPWSRPAARMRELVLAVRAIWSSWQDGTRLDFRGEFYRHTLMPPFFDPGPNPYGTPRIFLGGTGERMTEVAGEVADGFLCHGLTTERYVREVTLPALRRGRAVSGRTLDGFEVGGPMFVVTGRDEAALAANAAATKSQIAFYASTPAYRPVLAQHGWGDLQPELSRLARRGRWSEMGDLVDDDVLDAVAVVAPLDRVAAAVYARWGGLLQRLRFYAPYELDRDDWRRVAADLKALTEERGRGPVRHDGSGAAPWPPR